MYINRVQLKGFRNFHDATISFNRKTLIIGANEIGKSNLLYALRLLLDRTLPETALEPEDLDFYIHEDTDELEIVIEFKEVKEDCVITKMKGSVSDDGTLFLKYHATRDPNSRRKSYELLCGHSIKALTTIENNSRYYLRVMNIKFMGSSRDLFDYIRRERRLLLQEAKNGREKQEIENDSEVLGTIEANLKQVETSVKKLSYVDKATENFNRELKHLSVQNTNQDVVFDTGTSDVSQYIDNLRLASQVGSKTLSIGGDGRNNQIQLALWASRNNIAAESDEGEPPEPVEVSIFCIEEPEAHLHPHQQRKLAEYLYETLSSQVIITSHSPQIACEFPPSSIVRLYNNRPDTLAAEGGSSETIEKSFIEFGYRLNIIPAEAFFSSVAFLVEGPSEELFYKALAAQMGVDLDNLNISILMVDGVGFAPYASLLHSLQIQFVICTDNDVFKVPGADTYRLAGVQRAIKLYQDYLGNDETLNELLNRKHLLQGFPEKQPPREIMAYALQIRTELERLGIYLSDQDLEHDLQANLGEVIGDYFTSTDDEEVVKKMQKRKATFMFEFLRKHPTALSSLTSSDLAKPLLRCRQIASAFYE